jgi:hypothetical protein
MLRTIAVLIVAGLLGVPAASAQDAHYSLVYSDERNALKVEAQRLEGRECAEMRTRLLADGVVDTKGQKIHLLPEKTRCVTGVIFICVVAAPY